MDRCDLSGRQILLTGCTGFIGRSILRYVESLPKAHRPDAVIGLARTQANLADLSATYEWLRTSAQDCTTSITTDQNIDLIIHAATPASAQMIANDPAEMTRIILSTTDRVLEFAESQAAPPQTLFTSTGAVYDWIGRTTPATEDDRSAPSPLDVRSCYAEAKRMSELKFAIAANDGVIDLRVARLFAFAGPDLPLNAHFAIGNFINDAVHQRPIRVLGHPDTKRSYMWHDDMSHWLFKIVNMGSNTCAYNVGSDEAIRIGDLAEIVATTARRRGIDTVVAIDQQAHTQLPSYYVPNTSLVRNSFGLGSTADIEAIVERMIVHHMKDS